MPLEGRTEGVFRLVDELSETMNNAIRTVPTMNSTQLVRPLTSDDTPLLEQLYERYAVRLLTPMLNIKRYGLTGPTLRAWGSFRVVESPETAILEGLLFRFHNTIIAVDEDGRCSPGFCSIIDAENHIAGVRGSWELVSAIQMGVRRYRPTEWENSYLLRLSGPLLIDPALMAKARRARTRDLDLLADLYRDAGTMYRSRANIATRLEESRVYVVEDPAIGHRPARIASCGILSPEDEKAGLIGGVYTMPAARGRGYAAAVVAALSNELLQESKLPVLFYENPVAGRVYRRLGFEECDQWAVLHLRLGLSSS